MSEYKKKQSVWRWVWMIPLLIVMTWLLALLQHSVLTVFPLLGVTVELVAATVCLISYRSGWKMGVIAACFGGFFLDSFAAARLALLPLLLTLIAVFVAFCARRLLYHFWLYVAATTVGALMLSAYRILLTGDRTARAILPTVVAVVLPAIIIGFPFFARIRVTLDHQRR